MNTQLIDASTTPPKSRLNDPGSVSDLVNLLYQADESRSKVRSLVRGLVDGNPPYNPVALRNNGQAYRTNVNFREAEAFLAKACSAFYDIYSEVPNFATVRTKAGKDEAETNEWSQIITEEFDKLQKSDTTFDYAMQLSQSEMVLMGKGPLTFEDPTDWRCKPLRESKLLVLDDTKSDVTEWPLCVVVGQYRVDELWAFIEDEASANAVGWDVEQVKQAMMDAVPQEEKNQYGRDWEFYQQKIRDNDLWYAARAQTVTIAHVYYKEKSGKISHVIIRRESGRAQSGFLYKHLNEFDNWYQCIHPMYYDRGDGLHHSVKGLGVKMYAALELSNRKLCALADASFAAAQITLQPQTNEALNRTGVVQLGPYSVLPPGYNVIQRQLGGFLDGPMAVKRELEVVLENNLSQYRQRIEKPQGNPRTATEIQAIMANQSILGKTQLSRYYEQLDRLFEERFRRAARPTATGDAKEFQKRCFDQGVPAIALRDIEYVRASRSVGQGSQFLRQQQLMDLLGLAGSLPESGRQNLLEDVVAAKVGQHSVRRYLPTPIVPEEYQDQVALAALEHSCFRQGAPAIVTPTQNHVAHLTEHYQAIGAAVQSIEQGGNPVDVQAFLLATNDHAAVHIMALSVDGMRQQEFKAFSEQHKKTQDIIKQLQELIQQQQQGQQQQQQMMSKDQMEQAAFMRDQARKDADLQAEIARKDKATAADIAARDAGMAATIASQTMKKQA